MGTRIISLGVLAVFLSTAMLLGSTDAATHVVGDSLGWRVPSSASVYANWASQHNFSVGDVLVFNFPTGQHDVARVSKAAFDGCNSSSPISLITLGPTNITLNSTGQEYFLCTFGQHCLAGQKLAIDVSAATISPSPSPTPSPEPPSPSPTPTPSPTPSQSPSPVPSPPSPSPTPGAGATPPGTAPPPGSLVPPPSGSGSPPPPGSELPPPNSVSPPPSSPPNSAPVTAGASIFVIFVSVAFGIMF